MTALWRVGRQVGRTVYVGDELVGVMDTRDLADQVVLSVNTIQRAVSRSDADLAYFGHRRMAAAKSAYLTALSSKTGQEWDSMNPDQREHWCRVVDSVAVTLRGESL